MRAVVALPLVIGTLLAGVSGASSATPPRALLQPTATVLPCFFWLHNPIHIQIRPGLSEPTKIKAVTIGGFHVYTDNPNGHCMSAAT